MEKLIELSVPAPRIRGPFITLYGRSRKHSVRIDEISSIEDSKRLLLGVGEVYHSMVIFGDNRQVMVCHRSELLMDLVDEYYAGLYPNDEQHAFEDVADAVDVGVRQSLAAMN